MSNRCASVIFAFAILKPDGSGLRRFDAARRTATVAGMVRHAVALAARAAGWGPDRINTFVHGHDAGGEGQARGPEAGRRLAYLPLPSLTPRGAEGVRRVLVVGPAGTDADVAWARRALAGAELLDLHSGHAAGLLAPLPADDPNVRPYVPTSAAWSTVTPVVMPGHDDRRPAKAERLLRRALEQAGLPAALARSAGLEWRRVGFRAGVAGADRYVAPPSPERRPLTHVRVRLAAAVRGPWAIGAGRYRGFGLMAAES